MSDICSFRNGLGVLRGP